MLLDPRARWREAIAAMREWEKTQTNEGLIAVNQAAIWAAEHVMRLNYRPEQVFELQTESVRKLTASSAYAAPMTIRFVYSGRLLDVRYGGATPRRREIEYGDFIPVERYYDSDGKVTFDVWRDITHVCLARDFDRLMIFVYDLIDELEAHERMEHLRYDGKPVFDPHPPDPMQSRWPAFRTERPDKADVRPFDAVE